MGQSNSPSENYLFLNVMVNFVIVNQKLTGSALHIEKNQTIVIVNFHGSVILPYCIKAKRCMGYWSGLALCLTKVRSSRARCPSTALIFICPTGVKW